MKKRYIIALTASKAFCNVADEAQAQASMLEWKMQGSRGMPQLIAMDDRRVQRTLYANLRELVKNN